MAAHVRVEGPQRAVGIVPLDVLRRRPDGAHRRQSQTFGQRVAVGEGLGEELERIQEDDGRRRIGPRHHVQQHRALRAEGGDEGDATLERPFDHGRHQVRSEEHTSELQSLMRISYAVFCLKKKTHKYTKISRYYKTSHTYNPEQ